MDTDDITDITILTLLSGAGPEAAYLVTHLECLIVSPLRKVLKPLAHQEAFIVLARSS